MCPQVAEGGGRARSDDFNLIRDLLVDWIKELFDPPRKDEIVRKTRENRGLANDLIGRLLCPYELDWDDPR